MRGLVARGGLAVPPKAIAFELADLHLAMEWARQRNFRMSVRLDHGAENEEYEEVIELSAGPTLLSGSIVWRNAEAVFVQPVLGKQRRYASVADALNSLLLPQRSL